MANRCARCGEPITADDAQAPIGGDPLHFECGLRLAVGSIAHWEKRCGCYVPGSDEGDPPDMTRRDAARLVYAAVQQRQLEERAN